MQPDGCLSIGETATPMDLADDHVFKALADPSRRRLLDRLNERNGQTLYELCVGLDIARQSVSKHLAVLEAAGVVHITWRGREKLHFLNAEPINAIADRWMTQYDRARAEALADLKTALQEPEFHAMTTAAHDTFVYITYIQTTADRLWTALTDPAFTKRYWGVALTSDWTVDATVTWELEGIVMEDSSQVVIESDRPRRLSYRWHALTPEFVAKFDDGDGSMAKAVTERRSKVTFDIEAMGTLCKLTVTHDDFDPDSVVLAGVSQGWPPILASLKTLLETGEPLALDAIDETKG
jgi:DNA-binding transcriptional ArsR family regulator/uncharacterized protein YndB with AHSA1/START domain